jgi:hypothetical protein
MNAFKYMGMEDLVEQVDPETACEADEGYISGSGHATATDDGKRDLYGQELDGTGGQNAVGIIFKSSMSA